MLGYIADVKVKTFGSDYMHAILQWKIKNHLKNGARWKCCNLSRLTAPEANYHVTAYIVLQNCRYCSIYTTPFRIFYLHKLMVRVLQIKNYPQMYDPQTNTDGFLCDI